MSSKTSNFCGFLQYFLLLCFLVKNPLNLLGNGDALGGKKSVDLIICIANFNLCLYSWLFHLGQDSHGNTPFVFCFASHDEIQFTTKSAPAGGADSMVHASMFRTASDGGWLGRSIGLSVPPPIPVGGAPYTVTHSRRKYHHPRMCLMASALPGAVCGAGGVRFLPPVLFPLSRWKIPAHPPSGFTHSECI